MSGRSDNFSSNVWWNIVSLGVAGVCGVAVNYLVGAVYGAAALGMFNQVFAMYIVVSQLAVLGVHGSVLFHVAATHDPAERRAIVTSALLITIVIAIAMGVAFVAIGGPYARFVDSPGVATGMWWAAPGLVFFAIGKVTLAALNATQRMRTYAILQAGRVVLMAVALCGCVLIGAAPATLPVILSIGEGINLVSALVAIRSLIARVPNDHGAHWRRAHLRFGLRGFLAGLFGELNTRIDVIILGAFATDAVVGAYSFAALVAEGLYQVLIALRANYAPIMVRLLATHDHAELVRMVGRARNRTYLAAIALGGLAALGYALIVPLITHDPDLQRSWIYFAILIVGMVAAAGYTPFNQMLQWAGRPGWHTVMIVIVVASSAAACTGLTVAWSAVGAAAAVALTYAGSIVLLKAMVASLVRVRI